MNNRLLVFNKAKPVWIKDKSKIMNYQAGFVTSFFYERESSYQLLITGSALFRVFINGSLIHYGPARAGHGCCRLDSLSIEKHLKDGENFVAIEAAGYNCSSYYTLYSESYIQAEVVKDNGVIAFTDSEGDFKGLEISFRKVKVARYSFQRGFSEVYDFDRNNPLFFWTTKETGINEPLEIIGVDIKMYEREVAYPEFNKVHLKMILENGIIENIKHPSDFSYAHKRFIHDISDDISGYKYEEIEENPFEILQNYNVKKTNVLPWVLMEGVIDRKIDEKEYLLLDLGINNTGFIRSQIIAKKDSEVIFLFDEKLIDGKIEVADLDMVNVIKYNLKANDSPYQTQTFEVYGFRYIYCIVISGCITLNYLGLKEYSYPNKDNCTFECNVPELKKIFNAAKETYRQNTLDVFMDCPTRERAGWLCDSYFTAQSAQYFSGETAVEKVMLENFILASCFPSIPEGMLPMCYPADHINGDFIPQWAMWYIIELEGYLKRNPKADILDFKELIYNLLNYFKQYENSDRLLERIPGWNFIEWSKANEWVMDVNYPTNMLYSKALALTGKWYDDNVLVSKSEHIKREIIKQSYNGKFFIDNSVRSESGKLENTGNISEVCQYYAFFFEIAVSSDERFIDLYNALLNDFGPSRKKTGLFPNVAHANAFIGNYLRMELLLRWGKHRQIVSECIDYFYHMARITGTLWENDSIIGSLNHGFASYAGPVIIKAVLGVKDIDISNKTVTFHFDNIENINASCVVGTPYGKISVEKLFISGKSVFTYEVPKDFDIIVSENRDSISQIETIQK